MSHRDARQDEKGRRPSWLPWVGKWLRAHLWLVALLVVILPAWRSSSLMGWDDTFYWATLTSLWHDGDLVLHDDIATSRNTRGVKAALLMQTHGGTLQDTFPIGPSLLHGVHAGPTVLVARALGFGRWDWPLLTAVAVGTLFWGVLCWLLSARLLALWKTPARLWLPLLLLMWFGTPLWLYATQHYSSMPHLLSAALAKAWILALAGWIKTSTLGCSILLGIVSGCLALVRWQDAIYGLMVIPFVYLSIARGQPLVRRMIHLGVALGCASLVGLIQLAAWRIHYGAWLVFPQGEGYMEWTRPALVPFLFSGFHGMLTWHPLWLVGIAGLVVGCVRNHGERRAWHCGALLVMVVAIYVNACVSDWWGGASYGARRMTSQIPLLLLGLVEITRRLPHPGKVLAAFAIAVMLYARLTGTLFLNGADDLAVLTHDAPSRHAPEHRDISPVRTREEALSIIGTGYFDLDLRPGPLIRHDLPASPMRFALVGTLLVLVVATRYCLVRCRRSRGWRVGMLTGAGVYIGGMIFFLLAAVPRNAPVDQAWHNLLESPVEEWALEDIQRVPGEAVEFLREWRSGNAE